jgi:ATP-dependent Lon protease
VKDNVEVNRALPAEQALEDLHLMTRLTLISLDDTVVFPGMPVTLALDAGGEKHVFLMPHRGNKYANVGVVAEVSESVHLPGRGFAVSLIGLHRGVPGAAQTDPDGRLKVNVEERPDAVPPPTLTRELEREYRAVVEEILELRGDDGRLRAFVRSITEPGALADSAGYSPDLTVRQKIELLETLDVTDRLKLALRF